MKLKVTSFLLFFVIAFNVYSQNGESYFVYHKTDTVKQVDLIDYFRKIFKPKTEIDNNNRRKIQFSLFPTESNFADGRALVTTFNATFLMGDKTDTMYPMFISYPTLPLLGNMDLNYIQQYGSKKTVGIL